MYSEIVESVYSLFESFIHMNKSILSVFYKSNGFVIRDRLVSFLVGWIISFPNGSYSFVPSIGWMVSFTSGLDDFVSSVGQLVRFVPQ